MCTSVSSNICKTLPQSDCQHCGAFYILIGVRGDEVLVSEGWMQVWNSVMPFQHTTEYCTEFSINLKVNQLVLWFCAVNFPLWLYWPFTGELDSRILVGPFQPRIFYELCPPKLGNEICRATGYRIPAGTVMHLLPCTKHPTDPCLSGQPKFLASEMG